MTKKQIYKAILYYIIAFVALTILWNIALRVFIIPKYFYPTRATVVDIRPKAPTTISGGRQINYFPTYSYVDDQGTVRTEESRDGFNKINGFLFKKEVGDSFAAYYEKGSKGGIFILRQKTAGFSPGLNGHLT